MNRPEKQHRFFNGHYTEWLTMPEVMERINNIRLFLKKLELVRLNLYYRIKSSGQAKAVDRVKYAGVEMKMRNTAEELNRLVAIKKRQ